MVSGSYEDVVVVSESTVRAGLSAETSSYDDTLNLNLAEKLMVHTMSLQSNAQLADLSKLSFDVKNVRAAKVYAIGESGKMGMSAIVIAKDATGKVLGTYLGGFLVAECQ